MHESLSLDRVANPLVRLMLPFRMPRLSDEPCCICGAPSVRAKRCNSGTAGATFSGLLRRYAPRNDAAGSTEMQERQLQSRTVAAHARFSSAPNLHQAQSPGHPPRALALETRLLRLRHRAELPEAEERARLRRRTASRRRHNISRPRAISSRSVPNAGAARRRRAHG